MPRVCLTTSGEIDRLAFGRRRRIVPFRVNTRRRATKKPDAARDKSPWNLFFFGCDLGRRRAFETIVSARQVAQFTLRVANAAVRALN